MSSRQASSSFVEKGKGHYNATATANPNGEEKTGWLQKKGFKRRNWTRRYFRLEGRQLRYFAGESARKCKGLVPLRGVSARPSSHRTKKAALQGLYPFEVRWVVRWKWAESGVRVLWKGVWGYPARNAGAQAAVAMAGCGRRTSYVGGNGDWRAASPPVLGHAHGRGIDTAVRAIRTRAHSSNIALTCTRLSVGRRLYRPSP